ncbi:MULTISPECIES: hypothetical protein [Microbacterium]|uniref:hypothetical protein n=1 Tax=Microbacterium TaxID=33882 RepID=UPI0028EEC78E|nr:MULTISPECIES: hypothetical protein [Microbacterium]
MSLFSSREPFNEDPLPWVHPVQNWRAPEQMINWLDRRARTDFDVPQHNPTNPILVAFRESLPCDYTAAEFSEIISDGYLAELRGWSTAEVDQALRVLNRLAVLEQVAL